MYSLILRNAEVVDPFQGINREKLDIGINEGEISNVSEERISEKCYQEIDLKGNVLMPGIIDLHVHVGGYGSERYKNGIKMLAQAGVTSALDLGSEIGYFLESIEEQSLIINLGSLFPLIPGTTVQGNNPSRKELEKCITKAIKNGQLGIKLLGGHYPLTPEATRNAIELGNDLSAYVAFHLGTTRTNSDITGVRELPELIFNNSNNGVHIAHVNAYCRGLVRDEPEKEIRDAFKVLDDLNNCCISESHLASINWTSGKIANGKPKSHVTRNCLKMRDYPLTEEGLKQAVLDEYASVLIEDGGVNNLISGGRALSEWQRRNTNASVSFPVTPPITTFKFAAERNRETGKFKVDAITSDGGAFPRNFLVERGLALYHLGAISLMDFAEKTSARPAAILGLQNKGKIARGCDADFTVLDVEKRKAKMSFVDGKLIMKDGIICSKGRGAILTTKEVTESSPLYNFTHEKINRKKGVLF